MEGMDQTSNSKAPKEIIPAISPQDAQAKDIKENKDIAALSYIWILSVFIYFLKRQSPFIRFHAKQGMVLFAFSILFLMAPSIFGRLLQFFVLVGCIIGFISAAQGQWRHLPIVYAISCGDMHALRQSWKESVDAIISLWHRLVKHSGDKQASGAKSDSAPHSNPTPPTV
jgi:fumarate reductase subunit D